jgi:hypothetical protein
MTIKTLNYRSTLSAGNNASFGNAFVKIVQDDSGARGGE